MLPISDAQTIQTTPQLAFAFPTAHVVGFKQQTTWPFRIRRSGLIFEVVRNDYFDFAKALNLRDWGRPLRSEWHACIHHDTWTENFVTAPLSDEDADQADNETFFPPGPEEDARDQGAGIAPFFERIAELIEALCAAEA